MSDITEEVTADSPRQPEVPGNAMNLPAPFVAVALLVVAVFSALIGERIVARFQRFFYPPDHNQQADPPEYVEAVRRSMMANMAIGYGLYGAVLLGLQGLALGAARKEPTLKDRTLISLAGLLVGSLTGMIGGAVSAPVGYYVEDAFRQVDAEPTVKAAFVLGLSFLLFSIGGALLPVLLGLARGLLKSVVTGVAVGLFVLVINLVVVTAAFPIDPPEMIFSSGYGARITALLLMAIGSAIAAVSMLRISRTTEAGLASVD